MDFKEINPLWRLSDPLTVQQAAALIAGFDPNAVRWNSNDAAWFESETGFTDSGGISWVQTAFLSLVNAINAGKLPATIRRNARMQGWDEWPKVGEAIRALQDGDGSIKEGYEPAVIYCEAPDWGKTAVAVSDLRAWLETAGIRTGFFFPTATDAPDYLDPKNPRYAPKMAAAVRAWQAMDDENLRRGKSAKSAMEQWIESNYRTLGLIHKRDSEKHGYKAGDMNKTAVQEAAKIANWEDDGGAPKTPGE